MVVSNSWGGQRVTVPDASGANTDYALDTVDYEIGDMIIILDGPVIDVEKYFLTLSSREAKMTTFPYDAPSTDAETGDETTKTISTSYDYADWEWYYTPRMDQLFD